MAFEFEEDNDIESLCDNQSLFDDPFDRLPQDLNDIEIMERDEIINSKNRLKKSFWNNYDFKPVHKKETLKSRVLIIEDDQFLARDYEKALLTEDFEVSLVFSSDDAIRLVRKVGDIFDIIIIDIRMYWGTYLNARETGGGDHTGIYLAKELTEIAQSSIFIGLSNTEDNFDKAFFERFENFKFKAKKNTNPYELVRYIKGILMKDLTKINTFIVHGHDKQTVLELKNFLQNKLHFKEPRILAELGSKGKTIIEKIEYYSKDVDLVFAIMTPDDTIMNVNIEKHARQNVLFEYGYFLGLLGRESGRIILLYKENTYKPSDISGIVHIDITNGIEAAGEEIRTEINALFE